VLKAPIDIVPAPAHGIVRQNSGKDRDRAPGGFAAMVDSATTLDRTSPKPTDAAPSRNAGAGPSQARAEKASNKAGADRVSEKPADASSAAPDETDADAETLALAAAVGGIPQTKESEKFDVAPDYAASIPPASAAPDVVPNAQASLVPDNPMIAPLAVAVPIAVPVAPASVTTAPAPIVADASASSIAQVSPSKATTVSALPAKTGAGKPDAAQDDRRAADTAAAAPIELPDGVLTPKVAAPSFNPPMRRPTMRRT
jgi:hypothetical protein